MNPGATEGSGSSLSCEEFFSGEGPCFDGADNDCDGAVDGEDTGCSGCGGISPIVVAPQGDGFHRHGWNESHRFVC